VPGAGVCAIVLAAGQGSRYRAAGGADKLLAPSLSDAPAPPVLAATLANLRGVAERLLVVSRADNGPLHDWLGAHAGDCERLLVETCGLGHSLAQAVAHAPVARGWLVALGDMPYVQPATLRAIVAAIDHDNLVVPVHQGRPGHPRGIGGAHRELVAAARWRSRCPGAVRPACRAAAGGGRPRRVAGHRPPGRSPAVLIR